MKNKKKSIQLPIRFDWINEIIYYSLLVILFGSAYLFAFNLLRFNWYSLIFAIMTLILIYLKWASYVKIDRGQLKVICLHSYLALELSMNQIDHFIFYKDKRLVEIKTKKEETFELYLTDKNKESLLAWLIKYYPQISPIYIEKD